MSLILPEPDTRSLQDCFLNLAPEESKEINKIDKNALTVIKFALDNFEKSLLVLTENKEKLVFSERFHINISENQKNVLCALSLLSIPLLLGTIVLTPFLITHLGIGVACGVFFGMTLYYCTSGYFLDCRNRIVTNEGLEKAQENYKETLDECEKLKKDYFYFIKSAQIDIGNSENSIKIQNRAIEILDKGEYLENQNVHDCHYLNSKLDQALGAAHSNIKGAQR